MFMLAMAIFVAMGGHRVMLATLIGSFDKVPLGGFADFAGLFNFMVGLLGVTFELAVRVAAPLLCLMFLETLSLGFIARTMPQLNILSVGFALRIVVGVICMILLLATAGYVYMDTLRWVLRQMLGFFALT